MTDSLILNGRYALQGEIGRGGMATTYRAHDRVLDRQVAVKVLHPHLAQSPEFAEAFRREAQAAARLSHPHVATVYDSGQDGDSQFLVMELIEGETLKARLRREGGPLSVSEAVAITRQIALALQAAHEHGLIHRDIKPPNVLVGPDGVAKVADFGIAQAATAALEDETRVVGSAHYLSPEQVRGEPGAPPSDIYALGVVLYEMLTGAVPFTGASPVAVAHRHLYDTPPVPRDANPAIPEALQAVVLKALQKRPEQRYATVASFLKALDAVTRPEPAPPRPQVIARPRRSRARRLLPAVVTIVLLGALVGSAALVGTLRSSGPADEAVPALVGTDLTSARALLSSLGFRLTLAGEEYDARLAAGLIVRQAPGPGTRASDDTEVQVWTSRGPKTNQVAVPDVASLPLEFARDELERVGLLPDRIVQEHHPTIASGFVTRTLPPAGRTLSPDTRVVIYVSMGPEPPPDQGPATPPPPAAGRATERVQYTVPSSFGDRVEVVVRVVHPDGGVEILHKGAHFAGEVLEVNVSYRGSAKLQIFVSGRLTHEAQLGAPGAEAP